MKPLTNKLPAARNIVNTGAYEKSKKREYPEKNAYIYGNVLPLATSSQFGMEISTKVNSFDKLYKLD